MRKVGNKKIVLLVRQYNHHWVIDLYQLRTARCFARGHRKYNHQEAFVVHPTTGQVLG